MISKITFQGASAYLLENDTLRAVVLPEHGGKIASLYHKEKAFELFFQNPNGYFRKSSCGADFALYEACGFDDTFPSIDTETVSVNGKNVAYPDHGEIWTASCTAKEDGDCLQLTCQSTILPYTYTKTLSLTENTLHCAYSITNTGSFAFPYVWTMHDLVTYREDMRILYPNPDTIDTIENTMRTSTLGTRGTLHSFPHTTTTEGLAYDFTKVPPAEPVSIQKFFVKGRVSDGFCGYEYPSEQIRASITYDKEKLPYLGFWITAGQFRGNYNCALEPATGYYDSVSCAQEHDACSTLAPQETFAFDVDFTLSALS